MSESNPLAGLTGDQADEAIERLQAKCDTAEENLKAVKAQLKDMKAARKNLDEPVPLEEQGNNNGTRVQADSAEITTEGGGR